MHALIIEDEKDIGISIKEHLEEQGIIAIHVQDSVMAEYELNRNNFNIIILDLGLPSIDGVQFIKRLRSKYSMPILILTARDSLQSKIEALECGADDYMIKPFAVAELLARMKVLYRRSTANTATSAKLEDIKIGKLRLSQEEKCIYAGTKPIDLSVKEYKVLYLLMHKQNKVVSKKQLQDFLMQEDEEGYTSESAIEVYMHRVRKKIENYDIKIDTVRGFGYVLKVV